MWKHWACALTGVVCLCATVVQAQTPFKHAGFDDTHVTYSPAPNEHVDPASGTLLITATDLVLPGNAGLDLVVQRVYNSGVFPDYDSGGSTAIEEDSWAGIGWRLHFGRVLRPSSTTPGETQIEMGDGSRHSLYTTTARPEGWMTTDFWVYDRSTHTLKLPNGTIYAFNRQVYLNDRLGMVRYVTEIRDIFNNTLRFTYFDDPGPRDGISEIRQRFSASDERVVTFTYDATLQTLRTMTYLTRTWTYTHAASGPAGYSALRSVQPPLGRPTEYQYTSGLPGEITITIAPTGGRGDYTYADRVRRAGSTSTTARVVVERRVRDDVGHLMTPGVWSFVYGAGPDQDTSQVISPCGTTSYRFVGTGLTGDFSAWSAGAMHEQTIEHNGVVLERQLYKWKRSEPISPDSIPGSGGLWSDPGVYKPLLEEHTITRWSAGGQPYTWKTTHEYRATSFNDYGQPSEISIMVQRVSGWVIPSTPFSVDRLRPTSTHTG